MQTKIINCRGQCRGRPPTRATYRDGPEVIINRLKTSSGLFLSGLKGRFTELSSLKTIYLLHLKIRPARDWPSITCSVGSSIKPDGDNERSLICSFPAR
jgi:hypothetical protein